MTPKQQVAELQKTIDRLKELMLSYNDGLITSEQMKNKAILEAMAFAYMQLHPLATPSK